MTRPEDHREIARHLEGRYGKLDILVNNAGVVLDEADMEGPGGFNTTSTVTPEVLRRTFETNFFAVVALTQALLPLIRKAPAGRIVNLSSILGSLTLHTDPKSPIYDIKAFAYDASKTALNAFTVHLAHELRDTPIKVNSAHPGWVKTDMGGAAAPLEVAEGGKTSVRLATLPDDGPTGGFFHLASRCPGERPASTSGKSGFPSRCSREVCRILSYLLPPGEGAPKGRMRGFEGVIFFFF